MAKSGDIRLDDVIQLTGRLVAIDSVTKNSNRAVTSYLQDVLSQAGFDVEASEYRDAAGEAKVNLVARKGSGVGGLGFFAHSDTVPGTGWDRDPWQAVVEGGRLTGLGSCDMKGPLAAAIIAGSRLDAARLRRPLYLVITADEENRSYGAPKLIEASTLLSQNWPTHEIVIEPTGLTPVYAHKGSVMITITAHGRAAHTSTDAGISANFLMAPFLAEMAQLAQEVKADPALQNPDFNPPTLGFNMTIDDHGCKHNVTAAQTTCGLCFRPAPGDASDALVTRITDSAHQYGFDVQASVRRPFSIDPASELVHAAVEAVGGTRPATVCYGSDAFIFQHHLNLVLLGPGDIAQAHTSGEWINTGQLHQAVDIYEKLVHMLCT